MSAPLHETTPDVGAVLGGRFRVTRRIGEGGMGVVLEAENTLTGKRVAIKWMHPHMAAQADAAERMVREARASARVRHPNVVDVYDVVQESGAIFLVMELLEGEPLSALMERNDAQPYVVIGYLLDAMRGVSAAHRQGVIHRDIKPDNIFLSREPDRAAPIPKVLDFGISKLTDREGLSLTRTGMTLGTPLYMSYEQLAGVRDIDGRTDVYAFGVILYEALTGQPPFNAETFSELIIKITTTSPPTPKSLRPGMPGALSSIVETAMRKERAERTPSLDALIGQLEPFATAEGYHSRVTALIEATSPKASLATPTPMSAVTARTLETFSEPPSIPTSFSARKALLWSGVALAIAGAALWLVLRGSGESAPHLATPATAIEPATLEPAAVAEPEPLKPAPTPAPSATAVHEPSKPKPAEQLPAASAQTPPSPTKARERAQRDRAAQPVKPAPIPVKPVAIEQDARPKPNAPGPRAGRPQSTEF